MSPEFSPPQPDFVIKAADVMPPVNVPTDSNLTEKLVIFNVSDTTADTLEAAGESVLRADGANLLGVTHVEANHTVRAPLQFADGAPAKIVITSESVQGQA